MISNFSEDNYIDVSRIDAVRWFKETDDKPAYGIIVVAGEKIMVKERAEFDAILAAFKWHHLGTIYNERLEKIE